MFGTTVDSAVERCRRDSLLASRGPTFVLDTTIDNDDTTLIITETFSHIGKGEMIGIDYELLYVTDTNTAARTITVLRGYLGTTAASHTAGTLLEVAPRFPKSAFIDWAAHEILSWGRKLFRVTSIDIPITAGVTHYSLPGVTGKVNSILGLHMDPVETTSNWWTWSWAGDHWLSASARLQRGLQSTADTVELQLRNRPNVTTNSRLSIAQPLNMTTFTDATDLVADVGMKAEWMDLLECGVKWRALSSTVIGRTDWRTSNVARAAEEVTPLDAVRAASHLRDLRNLKLSDAMVDLRGDWPWRER